MKISVITVCLNAANCIEGAIQSVLSQTYPDVQYIVIDGASTDGTMDIINTYRGRIDLVVSEKDNGIYDAMNKGIRLSNGDVIYFLGADDRLFDDMVLMDVLNVFQEEECDVVHGDVAYTDVHAKYANTHLSDYKGNRQMETHQDILRYLVSHQACFMKANLFRRHGLHDLKYKITADFAFLLKASMAGAKFYYIQRCVAKFSCAGASGNLIQTFFESVGVVKDICGIGDALFFLFFRGRNFFWLICQKIQSVISQS